MVDNYPFRSNKEHRIIAAKADREVFKTQVLGGEDAKGNHKLRRYRQPELVWISFSRVIYQAGDVVVGMGKANVQFVHIRVKPQSRAHVYPGPAIGNELEFFVALCFAVWVRVVGRALYPREARLVFRAILKKQTRRVLFAFCFSTLFYDRWPLAGIGVWIVRNQIESFIVRP